MNISILTDNEYFKLSMKKIVTKTFCSLGVHKVNFIDSESDSNIDFSFIFFTEEEKNICHAHLEGLQESAVAIGFFDARSGQEDDKVLAKVYNKKLIDFSESIPDIVGKVSMYIKESMNISLHSRKSFNTY